MNKRYRDKLITTLQLLIKLEGLLRNREETSDVRKKLGKMVDALSEISEAESDHFYNIPDNQMFSNYGMAFLLNSQDCENAVKELNYLLHNFDKGIKDERKFSIITKCRKYMKNSIER